MGGWSVAEIPFFPHGKEPGLDGQEDPPLPFFTLEQW